MCKYVMYWYIRKGKYFSSKKTLFFWKVFQTQFDSFYVSDTTLM